jgi:hypothetical protein
VTEATHVALLARFRRATLRRVQDAEGKQWLPGNELLEHAGFVSDETGLLAEPLTRTVRQCAGGQSLGLTLPLAARWLLS